MEATVVFAQPSVTEAGTAAQLGQWSTGLCDCREDIGDCCFATWCLPLFACRTTGAAGLCPCLPLLDCMGCVPPASLAVRTFVRERYAIKGDVWSDCFYSCCCYPLSWCQISRELKRRSAIASRFRICESPTRGHPVLYSRLRSAQTAHLC